MSNGAYGLNMLMEAMKSSEAAEAALEAELSLMDETADDEIKNQLIGEDSVENDMEGHGMSEEKRKKLEDFIDSIPQTKGENLGDEETMEAMMAALEACASDQDDDKEGGD